jgi:hypothetical protein
VREPWSPQLRQHMQIDVYAADCRQSSSATVLLRISGTGNQNNLLARRPRGRLESDRAPMDDGAMRTTVDGGPLVAVRDGAWCCLLCERKFKSERHIGRHLTRSDMHKVSRRAPAQPPRCAFTEQAHPRGLQEAYAAASGAGRVVEPSGPAKRGLDADGAHGSPKLRPSQPSVGVGVGSGLGVSALEQMEMVQQRLAAVSKVQKRQAAKRPDDEVDSNRVRSHPLLSGSGRPAHPPDLPPAAARRGKHPPKHPDTCSSTKSSRPRTYPEPALLLPSIPQARTINNQMDWDCGECSAFNFARVVTCIQCKHHVDANTRYLTNRLNELKQVRGACRPLSRAARIPVYLLASPTSVHHHHSILSPPIAPDAPRSPIPSHTRHPYTPHASLNPPPRPPQERFARVLIAAPSSPSRTIASPTCRPSPLPPITSALLPPQERFARVFGSSASGHPTASARADGSMPGGHDRDARAAFRS